MSKYRTVLLAFFTLLVFNCKSSKTIVGGEANFKLSTKQVIRENAKQTPDFKTLTARVKIESSIGEKSQNIAVNLRMEKDKTIWMSAFYGVGKVLITKDRVAFYDKWQNQYFDGNFAYISALLGTELDFEKVQNILLGEAVFNLKDQSYKSSVTKKSYKLQPKKQRDLFQLFLLLDPSNFKIKEQQISQNQEDRDLKINYLTHQQVEKQVLPQNIKIIAFEANNKAVINLELKKVSLNEALRFPFKIPSGFKEIKL